MAANSANHANAQRSAAMAEEIRFFRDQWGMTDREVAARLGYSWESYCVFRKRHPELGPVVDALLDERREWSRFLADLKSAAERRRSHRPAT